MIPGRQPAANGVPGRQAQPSPDARNGHAGPPAIGLLDLGPRRRRVLELLDHYPGLNLDEVAAALGVQRTAAKHHLHSLVRLGAVARCRQGRHVLHFLSGVPQIERTIFCLLRIPSVRGVVEALYVHPAMTRDQLANELGVASRTVRRAVRQLEHGGLLHAEAAGDLTVRHLHPRLRILLARHDAPPQARPPPPKEDIPRQQP